MSVFDFDEFAGHEHVSFFSDEASGLRAVVAIHSTAPFGLSGGGCRMRPYASVDEAVRDALRLSSAMSYNLALTDMPAGGAKAVIIGDSKKDKSEALLRALGRAVDRLGGKYIIAEDVGTTPADMRIIGEETKFVSGRQVDTGPTTAHGVFVGLRTAAKRHLDRDLSGLRVAVQGLGNVGSRLCDELAEAGALLVVSDVDRAAVERVRSRLDGVEVVAPSAILAVEADVLAPCALNAVLNDASIPKLRCQVVAGAANNQLEAARHADALVERGILYAPDFVINVGGVIGAAFEGMGTDGEIDMSAALRASERVGELLTQVFDRAEKDGINPHRAAVLIAEEKLSARSEQMRGRR